MCPAQGPQRSDAGEAQTRSLLVSSQALYHWATALPFDRDIKNNQDVRVISPLDNSLDPDRSHQDPQFYMKGMHIGYKYIQQHIEG